MKSVADLVTQAASALGVQVEWIKSRTHRTKQNTAASDQILILQSRRRNAFLAITRPDARLEIRDHATKILRTHSLGICVVLDRAASRSARFFRWNFYVEQVEEIPALKIEAFNRGLLASEPRPMNHRLENILFEAHSVLRDTDGLHPDEALDELCKIIDAKFFDELPSTKGISPAFVARGLQCDEETAADIRCLVRQNQERKLGNNGAQLKTSSTATAAVSAMFSPWSFSESDIDLRGRAFQKLLGTTFRGGLGQFFTPTPIVHLLIDIVQPRISESLIDPFCGSGHFLTTALAKVAKSEAHDLESYASRLYGVDINERMLRVARTDMRLNGDGASLLKKENSLLPFSNLRGITSQSFDIVVTNPPFGSVLSSAAANQLGPFTLARGNSTPMEILGLERSIELLKPGGRLAIVLPEGILTNLRLKYVREWLLTQLKLRMIVSFPREAFAPFGANIATCAILARKWHVGEVKSLSYSILTSELHDIGFDASGRPTNSSEISKLKKAALGFIAREGW